MEHVPEKPDFEKAVRKGIKEVCITMLKAPVPFIGIKGMRYLAKKWKNGPKPWENKKQPFILDRL